MNKKFNFLTILLLTFGFICGSHSSEPELSSEVPTILISNVNKANESVEFFIINNTNKDFYYEGWSVTSPIFGFETVKDTGWSYCGPYWCGTGLSTLALKTNQKVKISANFNDISTFKSLRIVLEFKKANSNEWIKVTSKELNLKK